MITKEREDYLKTIYKLQQEELPVRTTSIASALEIEPASVTGVIKRLSELNLVDYQPYKGVTLTEAGKKIALEVIRHHRLIELYLTEALGYSWDEVHEEAERLEHVVSDLFEERIAAALGDPDRDPHGSPIPTRDGQIISNVGTPLSKCVAGQRGTVIQVDDEDPDLLRYLTSLGIRPDVEIKVDEAMSSGGLTLIQVEGIPQVLGSEAAMHVFIDPHVGP